MKLATVILALAAATVLPSFTAQAQYRRNRNGTS